MRTFRRAVRSPFGADESPGSVATIDPPAGTSTKVQRRRYDPAWNDWNAPRRWPGVLISCLVVLFFMAILVWHFRPHETPIAHPAEGQPSPTSLEGTFTPGSGTKDLLATFKGVTSRSDLKFSAAGSLLVIHAQCLCLYNFDVTIDQGVDPVQIPVSTVGNENTVADVTLPKGAYQLHVAASGPWRIQLIQPAADMPMVAVPFAYFSTGDTVLGPFSPSDRFVSMTFLSNGRSDISGRIVNAEGTSIAVPFFGHSPYARKVTLHNLPSPYFLDISSVGFWDVCARSATTQTCPKTTKG